jgi:predicted nucleic-acid-binding Zn-ribbon protein
MSDPEPEYLPTEPEATQAVPEELLLPPRMFTPGWRCPKCGDNNPKIKIFDLSGGKADTEYFDLVSKSVKVQNATTYAEQLLMTCPQCLYSEARLPRDATRRRYQALADAGVACRTNGLQEYKCPCGCTDHDIEAVDIDGTPGTTAVYCSSCDRLLAAPIRCSLGDLLIGKLMEKNDVQP